MTNVVKLPQPPKPIDTLPICIDCKWHYQYSVGGYLNEHGCRHPDVHYARMDPVTGDTEFTGDLAAKCRSDVGHCGPKGRHFIEVHWSQRYRSIILLAAIVLVVLLWAAISKSDEPLPDSWVAQIEITGDPYLIPADKMSEFEAEYGAPMQPREGEMEDGGELDPTGKPIDMIIKNLPDTKQ